MPTRGSRQRNIHVIRVAGFAGAVLDKNVAAVYPGRPPAELTNRSRPSRWGDTRVWVEVLVRGGTLQTDAANPSVAVGHYVDHRLADPVDVGRDGVEVDCPHDLRVATLHEQIT